MTSPLILLFAHNRQSGGIVPLVSYDFTGAALPSGVTIARAGDTATRYDAAGDKALVLADAARFDYDPVALALRGLLVEPAATNLCLDPMTPYTDWTAGGATISAAGDTFLGLFTDGAVVASNGQVYHRLNCLNMSWTGGQTYTWAVFCKAGSSGKMRVTLRDTAIGSESSISGDFGSVFTIASTGDGPVTCDGFLSLDGGYLYYGTFTPNVTTSAGSVGVGPYSSVSGENMTVYALQMEAGATRTSFATGARAADQISFTIPSGTSELKYTFDDNSTQSVSVTPGASYTIPTDLDRPWIKRIVSVGDVYFPSSLVQYLLTGAALPSGLTFTRASSGTYFDASGVMRAAATDTPRIDYDPDTLSARGLYIEVSRTNLNHNDDNSGSGGSIATGQADVAGGTTACKFTEDVATSAHQFLETNVPVGTGNTYSYSAYVKYVDCQYVQMLSSVTAFAGVYANFDLINGTVTASNGCVAFIEAGPSGWFRIGWTATTVSTSSYANCKINSLQTGTDGYAPSFTGTSRSFTVCCVQVELGSSASSYITTTSTNVTRAADALQFTIPSGVATLRYTFDDDSTQDVSVSAGVYNVPTNLNRARIKTIVSV